ncbi:MAG TPA: hypothetical protein VNG13_05805 [Mycobacteriales bacterium]|nr:hypothetical protein [Mycobacteriales bacterium]
MTTHRQMPSEVEPDALIDLVADCAEMPPAMLRGVRGRLPLPTPRQVVDLGELLTDRVIRLADRAQTYL